MHIVKRNYTTNIIYSFCPSFKLSRVAECRILLLKAKATFVFTQHHDVSSAAT